MAFKDEGELLYDFIQELQNRRAAPQAVKKRASRNLTFRTQIREGQVHSVPAIRANK